MNKKKMLELLRKASCELSNEGRRCRTDGYPDRMKNYFDMADAIDQAAVIINNTVKEEK